MYEQNYEEYMRNVLGYIPNFQENTYRDYYGAQNQTCSNDRLEMMYPDIYKEVYPLVLKEIGTCNRNITEEVLNEMTDKICCEVEEKQNRQNQVERNEVRSGLNNVQSNIRNVKSVEIKEDRQLRPQNNFLRDLIKILLLREIIGRPGYNRPPMPRDYYV